MPNMRNKKGRDRVYFSGGHNEHDDRTLPHDGRGGGRRVSFKGGSGGGGRRKPNWQRERDNKIRAHLQDDDIEMITIRTNNSQYHKKYSKLGGYREGKKQLGESPSNWYRVSVRYGHKYDKDHLLKALANYIKPTPLIPYGYKVSKDEVTFVVEEHAEAEELMHADRKISMSDGWKLLISVRSMTPFVEIDDRLTTIVKRAMSARYNAYNKSLSLAKFHSDTSLVAESLFCPLNRPNLMIAVVGIIGEVIPDLQALDLSNNKLNTIDHLKILLDKAPYIKTLLLGNNKLRDIRQLDALKGLPVEELDLNGNSLCNRFSDKDAYIRAVRQRFPKVIKLDNIDLPPPILFGIEDEGQLPLAKASFMCDPNGATVLRQFLEQYYQLYDSTDSQGRALLSQAYHPQAVFSLDCHNPPSEPHSLSGYLAENRNLLRISNKDQRFKLLKMGQQNIVEAIMALPNTNHDPTSFAVDLIIFTPQIMEVSVCGVFKEVSITKKSPLKYFSRVFVIVPFDKGLCIINDQLTLIPATAEQTKKAFRPTTPPLVPAGVVEAQSSPVVPVVAPAGAILPEQDIVAKQQMVSQLVTKSGMNLLWAEKCLVETNWNFEQALFAFNELHKQGTIPPEAFIK